MVTFTADDTTDDCRLILNDMEVLNLETLTLAYQDRLTLLHSYIQPVTDARRTTQPKKKAIANKCNGISVQAYDKKAEIDDHSDKQYILDHYGNHKRLYRLEIRLHYQELKDYFAMCKVFPEPEDLFDAEGLRKMFFYHLSAVIRFTRGRRKMDWETLLKCNGRV